MAADYLSEALVVAEVGPVIEIVEEARKITVGTWWERAWGILERIPEGVPAISKRQILLEVCKGVFYWKDQIKAGTQTLMSWDIVERL